MFGMVQRILFPCVVFIWNASSDMFGSVDNIRRMFHIVVERYSNEFLLDGFSSLTSAVFVQWKRSTMEAKNGQIQKAKWWGYKELKDYSLLLC